MATINDVARRAGVSTYTVSAVMNRSARVSAELTQRVLQAVRELDYTINGVARSLQTRRTQTIGMLIPDLSNPFYARVVRGVEDVCKHHNYSLLIGNTNNALEEQQRYLMLFRSRQVDGFLAFLATSDEDGFRPLIEKKTPVVFLGRRPYTLDADSVTCDNRTSARLVVDHFLSRGHTRIGLILGEGNLSVTRDRIEGWRRSLRKAGIPADRELIREGAWDAAFAAAATNELLDLPDPPTAFFAGNFLMLTGTLRAIQERGRKGIDVISSDDHDCLDVFEPRITVIDQPSFDLGVRGAQLLFERIKDPDRTPEKLVLKSSLKIRC